MKAAILILALAASAQALPGSDPVSELVSVASQSALLPFKNILQPIVCTLDYASELVDSLADAFVGISDAVSTVSMLVLDIMACVNADDLLVCGTQAIRDAWSSSEDLRNNAVDLINGVSDICSEIKTVCFA